MVEPELIDDPIKLIKFTNKHIAKLEQLIALEEEGEKPNIGNLAKLEGHLVKWTEELQNAIRQAYQQGKASQDITTAIPKQKRFNA